MNQGLIAGYESCGLVDGPGSRFVLFFQGCNMFCPSCHNFYTRGECIACGACVQVCPRGALAVVDGRLEFNPRRCIRCDSCLDACERSANPRAQIFTVEAALDLIAPYKDYLNGVTFSGGEVTCQWQFALKLARACKEQLGLGVLLDTNGLTGARVWEELLPVVEGVLLDIKAVDGQLHQALTGTDNQQVLQSLSTIHGAGKLTEIRHLLIPGYTAKRGHFRRLCNLVAALSPQPPMRLQAYSNRRVRGEAKEWPSLKEAELAEYAARARKLGVKQVLTNM